MLKPIYACLAIIASVATPLAAQETALEALTTPEGQYLTIATGPDEAASIGSHALRLYGQANPAFPTDDFLSGVIVPRDGTLIATEWHDITGDGVEELVLISESAGSGSYRMAQAFAIADDMVKLVAATGMLASGADLIAALADGPEAQ